MREVHVAAVDDDAAVLEGGKVQRHAPDVARVGHRLAVHVQPGDAAVRGDGQPYVGDAGRLVDVDEVLVVAREPGLCAQGHPLGVGELVGRRIAVARASLQPALLREVAGEVGRVDHDAPHDARRTEPDDAPVDARGPAPAGLPAVHPLAALGELVGDPDRRLRLEQVVGQREVLVVAPHHRCTEPLVAQVRERGEVHRRVPPRACGTAMAARPMLGEVRSTWAVRTNAGAWPISVTAARRDG